jgi:hypothetical protein
MVSKLGFFYGTSFLLSTSRALKWPAKTIVEKATMKKLRRKMAAAAVWFNKTSNIPGTAAMVSKLGFFFWHKLFAIYYTLSGGRLVQTPLRVQNLCLKLSLYFKRSYFTGTKMACKDDCWEGDYKEAKKQTGCRCSSLTIAANPK